MLFESLSERAYFQGLYVLGWLYLWHCVIKDVGILDDICFFLCRSYATSALHWRRMILGKRRRSLLLELVCRGCICGRVYFIFY